MKMKSIFTSLFILCFFSLSFGQWTGIAGGIQNTNAGSVVVANAGVVPPGSVTPLAQFDVRGDNIILADPSTGIFPERFVGLGLAGAGSPNACSGYGLRLQANPQSALSLFLIGDNEPSLQFGPQPFLFLYKQDPQAPGCGNKVIVIDPVDPDNNTLQVDGNVIATDYNQWSDKRLKTNINATQNALEKVMELEAKTYFFKKDIKEPMISNLPENEQIGYLAQELQQVVPQAVNETSIGYLSVNYTMLIPLVTEAIKEQQTIIDDQRLVIENLEDRLAKLEKLVSGAQSSQSQSDNATLKQNRPNPFDKFSVIEYQIPDNKTGVIQITDASGKAVRQIQLTDTNGQVEVDAGQLTNGVYYYSLIIDGKIAKTEKMIIQ